MNAHFDWLNPPHDRQRHKRIDWSLAEYIPLSKRNCLVIVPFAEMWIVHDVYAVRGRVTAVMVVQLRCEATYAKLYKTRMIGIMVCMTDFQCNSDGTVSIMPPLPF